MSFNKNIKEQGFTIVELLIVIVVIGILAAITIVAYNGIQNRSNAAAAQSTANSLVKKAEAYNTVKSTYPRSVAEFNATDVNEANLTGSGINLIAIPASATGRNTVKYDYCISGSAAPTATSTATGARVTHFDYTSEGKNVFYMGIANASGSPAFACTTVTP